MVCRNAARRGRDEMPRLVTTPTSLREKEKVEADPASNGSLGLGYTSEELNFCRALRVPTPSTNAYGEWRRCK